MIVRTVILLAASLAVGFTAPGLLAQQTQLKSKSQATQGQEPAGPQRRGTQATQGQEPAGPQGRGSQMKMQKSAGKSQGVISSEPPSGKGISAGKADHKAAAVKDAAKSMR